MATRIHKMLVDLIARKMREKGYFIVAMEGNFLKLPENEIMPIPLKIRRHRPDLIGINLYSKRLCIGEAKTSNDLLSKRTSSQFSDFSEIVGRTSKERAELIIGVPLSSRDILCKLLLRLKISLDETTIVLLPEELAENEDEDFI